MNMTGKKSLWILIPKVDFLSKGLNMIQIDMGMPKTCIECPFLQPDSPTSCCSITEKEVTLDCASRERMLSCPLFEK